MKRILCGLAGLLLCAGPALGAAAEQEWVSRSNRNAQLLLDIQAKYSPESASSLGVEGYDEAISDFSRDDYEPMRRDMQKVIAELRARAAKESDVRVRQDLQILQQAAEDELTTARLDRKYFIPFHNLAGMVFGVVRETIDPRIPLQKQRALLARLDKYTGATQGYRPISELAKERTLERIKADSKLQGPFIDKLEKAILDSPTMLSGIRELLASSKVAGWESRYALLEKQLTEYNGWLKAELLPRARKDHRLPPEVYANNLRQYGVDITPEELISRALTSFAEIRNQMNITAGLLAKERGWPERDYRAVIRRLKADQLPADQVMPMYRSRLAQIEAIVREQKIVTLPDRAASIRLATPAENAQQPAPHMDPPRLIGNTGEYGEFVLTTGMSPDASGKALAFDDFSHPAVTWTLTAHEARPGHELQFARMIEAGVSIARAVFAFNSVNVEGWGLYAEAELQPYEPLDGQLVALQMRAHRAARAFLDPMVNLGQITPDQVKDFLMQEVVYSEGMAMQEMQRYVFRAPGQATSYFYGYQRIMETRQAAQLALRDQFDRQAYNDFLLNQGLLPPALLRQTVMEEFVGKRAAR
jgi:uncharacterized protein (DUF885 family)